MTATAYVRARSRGREYRQAMQIVGEAETPDHPTMVAVDGFGLYAVGVHPELGPTATYLVPTVGADAEPALCELVDGRLEVRLLSGALTLVVEGHPMRGTRMSYSASVSSVDPDTAIATLQQQRTSVPEDQQGAYDALVKVAQDVLGAAGHDDACCMDLADVLGGKPKLVSVAITGHHATGPTSSSPSFSLSVNVHELEPAEPAAEAAPEK